MRNWIINYKGIFIINYDKNFFINYVKNLSLSSFYYIFRMNSTHLAKTIFFLFLYISNQ